MGFKRYVHFVTGAVICIYLGLLALTYIVDPLGIWGTPVISGYTQVKVKQISFDTIFKPYEVTRLNPDTIFIGSSRVFVGFKMNENEYNLGMNALSLPYIKRYLHFIYQNSNPSKVYLGLDFFQFLSSNFTTPQNNFSEERLQRISEGGFSKNIAIVQDSMGTLKTIRTTITSNLKHATPTIERGWNMQTGSATSINRQEYYYDLKGKRRVYDTESYTPAAVDCLREIINEATQNNVEVVLFFNPISVDLLALQNISEDFDTFLDIKKEVAKIHPVYDFALVNQYTTNRQEYFYDASHFTNRYGKLCRAAMNGEENGTYILLNETNAQEKLAEEKGLLRKWIRDNQEYYEALKTYSNRPDLKVGTFEKYIGF